MIPDPRATDLPWWKGAVIYQIYPRTMSNKKLCKTAQLSNAGGQLFNTTTINIKLVEVGKLSNTTR